MYILKTIIVDYVSLLVGNLFGSFRAVAPVFRSLQCALGGTPLYKPHRYVRPIG